MKIFIGNLGNEVTSHDIFLLFSKYGDVAAAHVSKDENGHSRGFGYVLMKVQSEGSNAIAALNKKRFMGQFISVSEAIHSERYYDAIAV